MTFNQAFAIALMAALMTGFTQGEYSGWKSLALSVLTYLFSKLIWWFFVDRKSA
ncbi:hypothetical protein [Sphingobium fluviale]|uniref:hypothetical protein n=1 Tax=Sphingobium fluviale TaxID=2506423 RepID=UPI0013E92119|nr:hypothetical protein [Sphingobium fluviale]